MFSRKYFLLLLLILSISDCLCEEEDPPMADYEKEHIEFLRKNAGECTLFLNKNNVFPIEKPCKVLLVGSGARDTLKGGKGSGDVESRFYTTCEEGFEKAKFEIVSKDWLDEFPKFKKEKHQNFVDYVNTVARNVQSNGPYISFGAIEPEAEYDLPLDYEADIAIYVLSRISGENEDRRLMKGDIFLTDSEIRDILLLNKKFKKFMLVLNVCGVIDLSPIKDVSNILLLSQLGVVTGDVLADIVLGKTNPSGKLSTTWAAVPDYRFIEQFGGFDNTRYLEGVYVGYRYFDSAKVKPLYAFGYGKSYTDFDYEKVSFTNKKDVISIEINVTNIGKYSGKEVIQIYVSPSQENKDKPYQSLVSFKKTKLLEPEETELIKLKFSLKDVARYDEFTASYVLDKGNYIIRVGKSSDDTQVFGYVNLNEDIVVEKLKNIGGKPDFTEYNPKVKINDNLTDVEEIKLTIKDFSTKTVKYDYTPEISDKLKEIKDEDLGKICLGNIQYGDDPIIQHVFGEAGETVSSVKGIKNFLTLADGPAGLRVAKKYGIDEKGYYRLCEDTLIAIMKDFMSKEDYATKDTGENNLDRKGDVYYQFATAIPIATALGQTFNEELLEKIGDIIGEEMEILKINVWLAPALNIHRNIRCGRNFEYYSEDPLISGKMAAAMTRGVQSHKNRATTIKHFACNNQEKNRQNNNSILSERALREIYIRGFKVAIDESQPYALMTSYNLINGIHSSERKDLVTDVLRSEWNYDGLIMSDWYSSGYNPIGISNYPAQNVINNIKGGNNLQMGVNKNDFNIISKGLKSGEITRDDLLECASKVYETIELLNQ